MKNSITKRLIPVCIVTALVVIITALFSFSSSARVVRQGSYPKTQRELELVLSASNRNVYLAADITTDKELVVPKGSKITLSLMGHTIKRNNDSVTLDGMVFKIEAGGSLSIIDSSGIGTITGGACNNGGAIANYGDLYIRAGNFTGNIANKGGVIANEGTATIYGGSFKGNEAADAGGVIYNNGTLYIKGGNFLENKSTNSGGALYACGNTQTYVSDAVFRGNSSLNGGAVFAAGRSVLNIGNNTLMEENTSGDGGAIKNYGTLYFDETSEITGNSTVKYGGGGISNHGVISIRGTLKVLSNNSVGCGGGIWSGSELTCTENASLQMRNNRTQGDGGALKGFGILKLNNANIYNNVSAGKGGGLWCGGDTVIDNSTVWYNFCGSDGGGIYNSEEKSIALNNTTVRKNKAVSGAGMFICSKGAADIASSKINDNETKNNGNGGGIWIGDFVQTHVKLSDSTVDSNSANLGGAIYRRGGKLEMIRCSVSGNNSKNSGGGIYSRLTNAGIYYYNVRFIDCEFLDNTAQAGNGGAICFDNEGSFYNNGDKAIVGCSFTGNQAENGGAVYVATCRILLEDTNVEKNRASSSGGGVYVQNQEISLKGKVIINNNQALNFTTGDLYLNGDNSYVPSPGMRKGSYVSVDMSSSHLSYETTKYQMSFFHPSNSSKKLVFTKKSVIATPLYASLFSSGRLLVIIGILVLAAAAMIITYIAVKKRKEKKSND